MSDNALVAIAIACVTAVAVADRVMAAVRARNPKPPKEVDR